MENSILIIHNFIFHLPGRVEQKKRKKKKRAQFLDNYITQQRYF